MVSLLDVFKDFFTKKHIWLYILFILCYRLTEGFAVKMVPLFLKALVDMGGLGLSNESIVKIGHCISHSDLNDGRVLEINSEK